MRKSVLLSLLVALFIPILFAGCDNVLEPLVPLKNNEMRVTIGDYGSFDSDLLETDASGSAWTVKAKLRGENGSDTLVVTLIIPRRTTTPYTITVQSDNSSRINYCVQQTVNLCTDYDVFNGKGTGSITIESVDETNHIVAGTFNGTLVDLTGATTTTKSLSSGEFKFVY
jgi:hypothetical protein